MAYNDFFGGIKPSTLYFKITKLPNLKCFKGLPWYMIVGPYNYKGSRKKKKHKNSKEGKEGMRYMRIIKEMIVTKYPSILW